MDIEFHYYMTYLIATKAGFSPADAETIAHAAQSVDDNHIKYEVSDGAGKIYSNYISQTMNILRPAKILYRIYPIFHFIPGIADATSARRKDGRTDSWVTTPDGPVANKMIDAALKSKDLYRIGVSAHGYVDTWAHQNFLGRRDTFNDIPAADYVDVDNALNVGHGAMGHQPDVPSLVWTDTRLVQEAVDNRARFLDAASALFRKFVGFIDPKRNLGIVETAIAELREDLAVMIGPTEGTYGASQEARIGRYREYAPQKYYGGEQLQLYDEYAWFNDAINENCASLRQSIDQFLDITDDYVDQALNIPCTWRDKAGYMSTHWYKFAEAVKCHQNECWQILIDENISGLDATNL